QSPGGHVPEVNDAAVVLRCGQRTAVGRKRYTRREGVNALSATTFTTSGDVPEADARPTNRGQGLAIGSESDSGLIIFARYHGVGSLAGCHIPELHGSCGVGA